MLDITIKFEIGTLSKNHNLSLHKKNIIKKKYKKLWEIRPKLIY